MYHATRKLFCSTAIITAAAFPAFAEAPEHTAPHPTYVVLPEGEPVPVTPATIKDEEVEELLEKGTFSFTYENDIFTGQDDGYTNGVRIGYITPANDVPVLLEPLLFFNPLFPEEGEKRVSYSIGQSMFTPDDITLGALQPNDRPYAGWLWGSMGLISDTGTQYDTLELTLGIIGPYSFAEQTQHFIHKHVTDSPIPRGWDNQLHTEPGINIGYERKWRSYWELSALGYGVDVTPHAGLDLGNVLTDAKMGATFRFGKNLPSDYGPPRIRPSVSGSDFFRPTKGWGWYLFAGFEGRYVAHNIFLDGNTFADSHSVGRRPFVGDVQLGAAITYQKMRLAYTHVIRTEEYREQRGSDNFGALTLSYQF